MMEFNSVLFLFLIISPDNFWNWLQNLPTNTRKTVCMNQIQFINLRIFYFVCFTFHDNEKRRNGSGYFYCAMDETAEQRAAHIAKVRKGIRREYEKQLKADVRRQNAKFVEPGSKPGSKIPPAVLEQRRMEQNLLQEQLAMIPKGMKIEDYHIELGQVVGRLCHQAAELYPDGPAMRQIRSLLLGSKCCDPCQALLLISQIDQRRLQLVLRASPFHFKEEDREKADTYFQFFCPLKSSESITDYWKTRMCALDRAAGKMHIKEVTGQENTVEAEIILEYNESTNELVSKICADYGLESKKLYRIKVEESSIVEPTDLDEEQVVLVQNMESGGIEIMKEDDVLETEHILITSPPSASPTSAGLVVPFVLGEELAGEEIEENPIGQTGPSLDPCISEY
jgi:hypothetical protein